MAVMRRRAVLILANHRGLAALLFLTLLLGVLLALGLAAGRLARGQEAGRGVNIRIAWEKQNFALEPRVYLPRAGSRLKTWETQGVASVSEIPLGRELKSPLYVPYLKEQQVILVIENPGPAPVRFFAAPHLASPPEHSLGPRFRCLCIHTVFSIPSRSAWFRVLELSTFPAPKSGDMTFTHTLIGLPEMIRR